jgi:Tol biopolymer transport system component
MRMRWLLSFFLGASFALTAVPTGATERSDVSPYELAQINLDGTGRRTVWGSPAGWITDVSLPLGKVVYLSPRIQSDGLAPFHVIVADLDGANPVEVAPQIARSPFHVQDARLSPDGTAVAIEAWNRAGCNPAVYQCGAPAIWLARADGSGARSAFRDADSPAWSPSSDRLAFAGLINARKETGAVMVARRDGHGVRRIGPIEPGLLWEIAWAPRGEHIAYSSGSSETWLRIKVARTRKPRRVDTIAKGLGQSPTWAPDGQRLAFVDHIAGGRDALYVTSRDRRDLRRIAVSQVTLGPAEWSPDGRHLAYQWQRPAPITHWGTTDLWVVRANGHDRRQVTHEVQPAVAGPVRWSADGRQLVYVRWIFPG